MRRLYLAMLTALCAFVISCTGDVQGDCAFQADDGTCAVVVSGSGALECRLDDAALCATMTSFLETGDETGEETVASSTAALVNSGARIGGGGLSLVCEPDGTFMCHCCSVKAGCYPCPKKVSRVFQLSSEASDTTGPASALELSAE